MGRFCRVISILSFSFVWPVVDAANYKPIELHPDYEHDKWVTLPHDYIKEFRAYTVSFDTEDDNDGDGEGEEWAVPEWVAYEIRAVTEPLAASPGRPSRWITEEVLFQQLIAPDDDSYKGSGYSRGHMCMKHIAFRLGENADWNTHTVLNACPQIQPFNAGIWLNLEEMTAEWADLYGKVWVICGPVFYDKIPTQWIGGDNSVKVAIPDGFFKIVIKESEVIGKPDVLAFLYPHNHQAIEYKQKKAGNRHELFMTSVDKIEALTGLDFLTNLEDRIEAEIEKDIVVEIWE